MNQKTPVAHEEWSSSTAFILAAAGSAVGLGNIWKFPYMAGMNGGGAFVLVYLLAVAVVGIPTMMAETMMGRRAGRSPLNAMPFLAREAGQGSWWRIIAVMGLVTCFLILSFYSVISGWVMYYLAAMPMGYLQDADPAEVFQSLLANPMLLLGLHTLVMALTMLLIGRGVSKGLELAARWLMPALFIVIVLLVLYAATLKSFGAGVRFLLHFRLADITGQTLLMAVGQAFFSLSIGMCVIMAFGAYAPRTLRRKDGGQQRISIGFMIVVVALIDTAVALLSGLAIFPMVFEHGLQAGEGPGLVFVTLPMAFAQMKGGMVLGTFFFAMVFFGALTSAVSLGEPPVAYLTERGMRRSHAAALVGGLLWFLGIGTVLSFNLWSDYTFLGRTVFDNFDFVSSVILMPIGGLLIALFAGWVMPEALVRDELSMRSVALYRLWRWVLRYITPVAIAAVLGYGFYTNPLVA